MMVNRTKQPDLKTINKIDFIAPTSYRVNEDVKLYHMKDVPNDTARFDLYFDAGKCRSLNAISSFVNGLLLSGTNEKTAVEINSEINGLGGYFESGLSAENAVLSIYCLRENLLDLFHILLDAINNVNFNEKEVSEFLADRKQSLNISMQKVSYLAQRSFQEKLFSSEPTYSRSVQLSDFEDVSIQDLKSFHQEHICHGLTKMVIVGNIEEENVQKIIDEIRPMASTSTKPFTEEILHDKGFNLVPKKDAIQNAIRIGRILFNKTHEDYLDFLVLNSIIGDYFGSRLMTNIREDKGYTYGIGSMVAELNNTGYFMIATEVGSDVTSQTLHEIKFELNRLRTELVPIEELNLVKNYMLGQLLKSADGPYAMTDLFLSVEMHNKELDFYNLAIQKLNKITPERIRDLAKKYFNWEDMTIIVAGQQPK